MTGYPPPRDPTGPDQESVWDYPRPPALLQRHETVTVTLGGVVVARTDEAWEALETSHPPTFYLPREAFVEGSLRPARGSSFCEWKGRATYLDVVGGDTSDPTVARQVAWTYPEPTPAFAVLRDHVSLYPEAMDECTVAGEVVRGQPGGFYGGWVTSRVTGPFKGEPGTLGW